MGKSGKKNRDEAIQSARRLFGFKRTGRTIQTTFSAALAELIEKGALLDNNGVLCAAGNGNMPAEGRENIPRIEHLLQPVLRALTGPEPLKAEQVRADIAQKYGLTEANRKERAGAGNTSRFSNHIAWALVCLQEGKLVSRTEAREYRATKKGRAWIKSGREPLTIKMLRGNRHGENTAGT